MNDGTRTENLQSILVVELKKKKNTIFNNIKINLKYKFELYHCSVIVQNTLIGFSYSYRFWLFGNQLEYAILLGYIKK